MYSPGLKESQSPLMFGFQFKSWIEVTVRFGVENEVARMSQVVFGGTCFRVQAGGRQKEGLLVVVQLVLPMAAWMSPVEALKAWDIELHVAPGLKDLVTMSWFGLGQEEVSLCAPVRLSDGGTAVA